jgi:two-component system cell cycle response regulator DivK
LRLHSGIRLPTKLENQTIMRILYVEDNEVNRALVERVVRARQYGIVFCDEGEGALAVLAKDPTIDLVLLDIELAGAISGLDVVRTLRDGNDKRPVVAITAYAMMGDRERILAAGCDQYLPKPLAIAELLALLDHYQTELAQKPPQPEPVATQAAPAARSPAPPPETPAAAASPEPEAKPAVPAPEPVTTAAPVPKPPSSTSGTPVIASEVGHPGNDGRTPQGSQPT